MAIKAKKEEVKAVDHEIKVERATAFKNNDNIGFDVTINGVRVNSCILVQGAKDGKEYSFVSFPQRSYEKDGETKYFPYIQVKLSENDQKEIEKQIEAMLE